MFEDLPDSERITLAKTKMDRVIDHFLHLLALHENNTLVVFSPMLASQIPRSYAANAFNVFQHAMHDFEIVRICALWDTASADRESIPSVVALIDHRPIIDAIAEETRTYHLKLGNRNIIQSPDPGPLATDGHFTPTPLEEMAIKTTNVEFGDQRGAMARAELSEAIASTQSILSDPRLDGLRNYRDKHLAHSLSSTHREKSGPLPPVKYGYAHELLDATIPIVEKLHLWVVGKWFSISHSREISRDYAEALWKGCSFTVQG